MQGFDVADTEPVAVQEPAAHAAVQVLAERLAVLPCLPAGQAVGALTAATQKNPAMQLGEDAGEVKLRGQYFPAVQAVAVAVVLLVAMQ